MRWCAHNCICRFLHRHLPLVIVMIVILLSANQLIYFSKSNKPSTLCYKIVSPLSLHSGGNTSEGQMSNATIPDGPSILPNILWDSGRFDDRRMIKIYEWIWRGTLWSNLMNNFNVCLATQGSIDRISSIAEVSEKWLGPISLAVYVKNGEELWILSLFASYMRRCSVLFLQTVSIHVVVPVNFEPPDYSNQSFYFDVISEDHPCGQPQEFMSLLISKLLKSNHEGLYPQNHMRNIARKTCPTPWVFMTDVDIIPKPNSTSMLHKFYGSIASKCQKCAFVVPVFELDRSVPYPRTKQDLVHAADKGLARQFHREVYKYGHLATNYETWMSMNLEEEDIKISHSVDNKMNHYEPFYVSTDDIPKHDERFIGYGFTRSSQVLESRIMGWKFYVLTPIFAIHWGLQTPESIRSPSMRIPTQSLKNKIKAKNSRKSQNSHNYGIYTDFVSELVARYNISVSRKKAQKKQQKKG